MQKKTNVRKGKEITDKPIAEGYIAGGATLLVSILWIWVDAFHPLVIFGLYLISVSVISLAVLWHIAREATLRSWFVKHPVRFFIVGFVLAFLIVVFLDFFYLGKLGGVLVEAHGLLFDLLLFGIILTLYEVARSKQDKIERWTEELDDYRGWTENEAAYRVAGLIRRLTDEGVTTIDTWNLHLGKTRKDLVIASIKENIQIASLQGADLSEANLQGVNLSEAILRGANLQDTNLQNAKLHSADLRGANLLDTNLQDASLGLVNLQGTKLVGTNLQGASLPRANLKEVEFSFTKLQRADLFEADLEDAWLAIVNLDLTNLWGVNLRGAHLGNVFLHETFVDSIRWFKKLKEMNVTGIEEMEDKYYVELFPENLTHHGTYFIIKGEGNQSTSIPSIEDKQCNAITKKGEKCKRKTKKGGFDYCFQHLPDFFNYKKDFEF